MSRKKVLIGFVWLIILSAGLAGAELYARSAKGYELWTQPLTKHARYFFELDKLKIYNKRFYEKYPWYFKDWPIPLELFESDKPAPRYLFRPNLKMAFRDGKLVPAEPGEEIFRSSNSWGFRGPEFSIEKPPSVIRVVCLGASTTEGSQGDLETYPHFLQQELTQRFPNIVIEVINAGHHAHNIDDLLEILRQRVFPLRPDIVIFYEAANNLNVLEYANPLPLEWDWNQPIQWLYGYPAWYRALYRNSAVFLSLSDGLGWNSRRPEPMPHGFNEYPPKNSAIHYREVLRQIVRESLDHGSIVVLSSFITLAHEGLEISRKDNPFVFDSLYKKYYPFTPGELERMFQHFNNLSAEVAHEFGIPYADVAGEFPRDLRYFPFDIFHFSPEGNRLLAGLFAKFLEAEVLPSVIEKQKGSGGQTLLIGQTPQHEIVLIPQPTQLCQRGLGRITSLQPCLVPPRHLVHSILREVIA